MLLLTALSVLAATAATAAAPGTAGIAAPPAPATKPAEASAMACPGAAVATPAPACCFLNESYSGVCRVTPTAEETCDSILLYLNTPNTVGKTYCESTRIRGGWKQAPCPDTSKSGPPKR